MSYRQRTYLMPLELELLQLWPDGASLLPGRPHFQRDPFQKDLCQTLCGPATP